MTASASEQQRRVQAVDKSIRLNQIHQCISGAQRSAPRFFRFDPRAVWVAMAMEAVSMGAEEESWGAGQPPCESVENNHGDGFFFFPKWIWRIERKY